MASSPRSLLGVPTTGRRNCSVTSPVNSLLPSPAYLLNPGIKLGSPTLQVDSLPIELSEWVNISTILCLFFRPEVEPIDTSLNPGTCAVTLTSFDG